MPWMGRNRQQQQPQGQPIVPENPGIGPSQDMIQAPYEQAQPEQPQAPAWDRTAFRDAWMGSGVQNVPDMQNWLKSTGWGQHVGTAGSKGDVMQLPSGENIDAVLAAGLGGNRGGPQWTGRGSWNGSDQGQGQGIGPSPQMMPQNTGFTGYGGGQVQPQMSRTQQMQQGGQQQAQRMPQRQPGFAQRMGGMQPRTQQPGMMGGMNRNTMNMMQQPQKPKMQGY